MQLGFDVLAVAGAWWIGEYASFRAANLSASVFEQPIIPPALIVLIWAPMAYWLRLYSRSFAKNRPANVRRTIESSLLLSLIGFLVLTLLGRTGGHQNWKVLTIVFPISLVLFTTSHALTWTCYMAARRQWLSKRGIAVVATTAAASQFITAHSTLNGIGEFRGLIVPEEADLTATSVTVKVLGTTRQLAELINREDLNRVIVINDALREEERERCRRISGKMGVTISWIIGRWAGQEKVNFTAHDGLLRLDLEPISFTRAQERVKRALDLALGSILTAILLPLMLIIAILIKLTSPGPVIYKSWRVGRGGRHFTFLKFRSMYVNSDRARVAGANEKGGHLFKIRDDPRVTPIGSFLRRYSLDELPQFFNVLRGEMSLVGPRPLPANDLDPDGMSERFSAWSELRSRVRPGITGLWQIKGRSDLEFEQMMTLDVEYIKDWSLTVDIWILLQTPEFVLSGRGAY